MPNESYADLAKPKNPPSLTRSLFLALLMLFGVFLMAPLVELITPEKTQVGRTDDVEIPEPEVAPELPESLTIPEAEVPLPEFRDAKDEGPAPVSITEFGAPPLQIGSGSAGLVNPLGEISGLSGGPPTVGNQILMAGEQGRVEGQLEALNLDGTFQVQVDVGLDGSVRVVSISKRFDKEEDRRIQEIMTSLRFQESVWGTRQLLVW